MLSLNPRLIMWTALSHARKLLGHMSDNYLVCGLTTWFVEGNLYFWACAHVVKWICGHSLHMMVFICTIFVYSFSAVIFLKAVPNNRTGFIDRSYCLANSELQVLSMGSCDSLFCPSQRWWWPREVLVADVFQSPRLIPFERGDHTHVHAL